MDEWVFIATWLLVSVAALTAGFVRLARRKGYPGGSLLALGLVLLLAPIAFLWVSSEMGKLDSMQVEPLDPPNDEWLFVELRHSRSFDSGIEYTFNKAGDLGHVVSTFQAQHPDGVVTTASPEPIDTRDGVWHLSREDVRFDLVYDPDSGWYELATQMVVVHPDGSGLDVRIPFPRTAFGATEMDEGQVYTNGWIVDQWDEFYADISEARIDGETITVPTNRGGTAIIEITDGLTRVTLD